ncbi:RDD family protein [Halothiobacillus sp. DCM-1]|uniref:RDD family protein n=1 Tax=Halothiobacillus sp. DCM-1 TaxID=3112558 RepID=UPI003247AF9E
MTPAPLWRRAAALFYDSLFVLAVLMLATLIFVAANGGQAVPPNGILSTVYRLWLLLWVGAYFVLFWYWGGQTPGMKVWHIQVLLPQQQRLRRSIARFFLGLLSLALAGIPFWLAARDPERRDLWDRRLGVRVIRR